MDCGAKSPRPRRRQRRHGWGNPKSEARNPKEVQYPNKTANRATFRIPISANFFRPSDFGLRILTRPDIHSNLYLGVVPGERLKAPAAFVPRKKPGAKFCCCKT